jgi:short-subunit dehydrogenase
MDISTQTFLLTGATGGIGSSLAHRLFDGGASLILQGRSPMKLFNLKQQLAEDSDRVTCLVGDLSRRSDINNIVEEAIGLNVTGLINNAGINKFSLFEDSDVEQIISLNVIGTMLLTQSLLPHFRKLDSAFIVNLGSTFGSIGFPGYVTYCASKHAMKGFTEALKRELSDTGTNVLYVSPRATSTSMNSRAVEELNSELGVFMDSPGDVATAILNALTRQTSRSQLGWPEKIQAKINALLPGVVDSALAKQLPIIKKFATNL